MLRTIVARLGLSKPEHKVLIAGNDTSGKTTLLYRAKTGELVRTMATMGFNVESLSPLGDDGPRVTAWDVGGGSRFGPMYRHYVCDLAGLVFVIRPTDPRMWSALWELYLLVKYAAQNGNPGIAVCVVVPVNECSKEDGSVETWQCLQPPTVSDAERTVSSYAAVTRLAERDCLPPGGTRRWSEARRWRVCDDGDGAATADEVDGEWLPGWEADRQEVTDISARTASHGMEVLHESSASPPLHTVHQGPWLVLPIDMHARATDAMLPFQWVARVAAVAT